MHGYELDERGFRDAERWQKRSAGVDAVLLRVWHVAGKWAAEVHRASNTACKHFLWLGKIMIPYRTKN